MGAVSTIQGYNVGSDVSFAITDQYGDIFSEDMLGHLTMFNMRSTDVKMKVTPISNGGVPIFQTVPNGLTGTMGFVRTGPSFQQLKMELDAAYFTSGTITQFRVSMNIRNRDGSVDSLLVTGVQFNDWDFGDFRGTKEVDLRVGFQGGQVFSVGSPSSFLSGLLG